MYEIKPFVLSILCIFVLLSFFVVANISIFKGNTDEYNMEMYHNITISQVKEACKLYKLKTNKLPNDLNDLIPEYLDKIPKDYWSRYFKIKITNGGFEAVTYGRDGKIRGQGMNSDIYFSIKITEGDR